MVQESAQHLFARSLRRFSGLFVLVSPQMKRVGENDVAEHVMRAVVGNVDCRVDLKISRQVAGDTNRG